MNREIKRYLSKYQPFFFPIGLLIGTIMLFIIGVVPATQKTITVFDEAKVVQLEVDDLTSKVAVLDGLDEASLEQQLSLAASAIPVDQSLPTLLQTVEAISSEQEVSLDSITVDNIHDLSTASAEMLSQSEKKLGVYLLPFNVRTPATFEQIQKLLIRSIQVRRFLRARSFNLAFSDENNSVSTITFDGFYLPLQSQNSGDTVTALTPSEQQLISTLESYTDAGQLNVSSEGSIPPNTDRNPFSF